MARGTLRLYLGAAPGVGKTYAMLNEGWRRKERGTDVVIGWVQEHGRPQTDAQIRDLEIFPRTVSEYRGQTFEEMNLDGLLERRPELVLVDELAHSNVPGGKHPKRWQDVEALLDAGINVISTINLQHLESLNDVVERITGVTQHETVPDPVVRAADQLELVDMAPEALRRRLAHGNIYPPERIDAALSNYFRPGNLTALRELALLWVADRVDEELNDYRERHRIAGPWETKERVVVSMTGSRGSAVLIRRAARMAMRIKAELVGVHVRTDDSLTGTSAQDLVQNRVLLEDLGGRYVEVVGADVAPALVQVALAENATQLVMGATHRGRVHDFVRGSVINSVIRAAGGSLDVHVIATAAELQDDPDRANPAQRTRRKARRPSDPRHRNRLLSPLPARRRLAAVLIGVIGFPLLTIVLTSQRTTDSLSTALSCYLVLVVLVAATGGVWPAVLAAAAGFLLSNYYFAPPVHTFTIADTRDVLALAMFLITAGAVSVLVDLATRRTAAAIQSKADATMLARVAGRMVAPEGNPLAGLLDDLMVAFRLDAASVLRKDGARATGSDGPERAEANSAEPGGTGSRPWAQVATAGTPPVLTPQDATLVLPLTDREVLALKGPGLTAQDRDVLSAFAAQLSTALESDRLHREAAEAEAVARANDLRSALLAAVSHDLHPPLVTIKAAASKLLSDEHAPDPRQDRDLLRSIDEESDRLNSLVENLLDMGRLQSGSIEIRHQVTDVHELVASVVDGLGTRRDQVGSDVPDTVPPISTDPALLERAIANLVDNALLHGGGSEVRIEVGYAAGLVFIRVVDRGPGIPRADRERVLHPLQRLAGAPERREGVGLGLALSRGFVEAVGGELDIEDTPGGGCTVVIRIPEDTSGLGNAQPEDPIADTSDGDRVKDQPDARDDIGGQGGDATAPTPAPVARP